MTFSYAGAVVPIVDSPGANTPGPTAIATLPVSGIVGGIKKIVFSFDGSACSATAGSTTVGLDHTFVNDLQIVLRSPAGTPVTIINRTDGGGNNFCQTVLDDAAGSSIQAVASASAPFTGTFSPNSPLSLFNGENPNGNWTLEVTDFFIGDTGNIRNFSVIITPAVCDAPALTASVTATKTAAGSFVVGNNVVYTVTLNNTGTGSTTDNPGNEFTDVLPATLALVSANATSGTAVATLGTNTVTWNGGIAAGGSVTINITATILPAAVGLTVSNQGTVSYDADLNGTNETTIMTDDPGTPAAGDPTSFVAAAPVVVPTLSMWALIILGVGLAIVAVRRLW